MGVAWGTGSLSLVDLLPGGTPLSEQARAVFFDVRLPSGPRRRLPRGRPLGGGCGLPGAPSEPPGRSLRPGCLRRGQHRRCSGAALGFGSAGESPGRAGGAGVRLSRGTGGALPDRVGGHRGRQADRVHDPPDGRHLQRLRLGPHLLHPDHRLSRAAPRHRVLPDGLGPHAGLPERGRSSPRPASWRRWRCSPWLATTTP